jgi:hypothetical protein
MVGQLVLRELHTDANPNTNTDAILIDCYMRRWLLLGGKSLKR